MKTYTVQIEVLSGGDEFWEENPSPEDVLLEIDKILQANGININDIKIVKIVDKKEYRLI